MPLLVPVLGTVVAVATYITAPLSAVALSHDHAKQCKHITADVEDAPSVMHLVRALQGHACLNVLDCFMVNRNTSKSQLSQKLCRCTWINTASSADMEIHARASNAQQGRKSFYRMDLVRTVSCRLTTAFSRDSRQNTAK